MDPDYRRHSRARWSASAAGWQRRADAFRRATMPVSAWMLDALDLQPGHTVLELAAGVGDVGFLAAEMIEPGGTLICSDFVPEMLTAAQARAAELGLGNVRYRQVDAESIDQPAGTLDSVLCRWGYMLMADPQAALRETRRVLRPGGRVALAAWSDPVGNPWSRAHQAELEARGLLEPAQPEQPGQFAWAPAGSVESALEAGGFVELHVEEVAFALTFTDFEDWWQTQLDLSGGLAAFNSGPDRGQLEEVRTSLRATLAEHTQPDGTLSLPARTWVAVAVA